MTITVGDVIGVMNGIAPQELSEAWDNSGLQAGSRLWEVKKVWVALDPSPEVVEAAAKGGADMLITHHPLLMKPLKAADFDTPAGKLILTAAENRMAIFSAHTNLDKVTGGLNDLLAQKLSLANLRPLGASEDAPDLCKLVVFVPGEYAKRVKQALFEGPAGRIGPYSCCSFSMKGIGTFRPSDAAKPFSGEPGKLSCADEVRVETVVERGGIDAVVEKIRRVHPYETMAYDVYPLVSGKTDEGIGRVGDLEKPESLGAFAKKMKASLGLSSLRLCGDPGLTVKSVALCTGSGGSLLPDFFGSGADLYITGDMRYHDARNLEEAGKGLIDMGHFASEHIVVDLLKERLGEHFSRCAEVVEVVGCDLEKDPFTVV